MFAATRMALGRRLEGVRAGASEARSFAVEPLLEFRSVTDEHPPEQRSTVNRERPFEVARAARAFETHGVAGKNVGVERDLLLAAALEKVIAELPPKKSKCLTQRPARVRVVELRPKGSDERVATRESARRMEGQESEQRQALGLREHGVDVPAVGARQLQSPEHLQVDHDVLVVSRISDQGCVRGPSHGPPSSGKQHPPAATRSTWCAWAGGSNRPCLASLWTRDRAHSGGVQRWSPTRGKSAPGSLAARRSL